MHTLSQHKKRNYSVRIVRQNVVVAGRNLIRQVKQNIYVTLVTLRRGEVQETAQDAKNIAQISMKMHNATIVAWNLQV